MAAQVEHMTAKEKTLHQLFSDKRVNPNREFFQIPPEKVVLAVRMGSYTEVTPGKLDLPKVEEQALEKAEVADAKRRARINLTAIGIHSGSVLTLTRDEDVHARVVSGNKVEYEGQIMSLSASALAALRKLGYTWGTVSGSDYWMYEGKTFDEIRTALEAEGKTDPSAGSYADRSQSADLR